MVSDILKRKSEYLFVSSSELKRKRFKQPMYKEIDDAVGIWMSQFLAANQILRGDILQKKAKQFADRFEFAEFIAFAENYEITSDELKILKGIRRKDNFTIHSETVWKETMRDCILEKGVTFDVSYREQKAQITNGIVRALYYRQFKKKAPDFPPTRADWTIKKLLINNFQHSRYFKKKRDHKNAKVVVLSIFLNIIKFVKNDLHNFVILIG
ncbi:hypothetical protein RhiirB3_393560 [Rhizophagus irregularis]|nr:hypothetical protein RhiirB3_393560 [Rhizophagus irregularis]